MCRSTEPRSRPTPASLVLAGVGLDLGSVDGHMAQLHQSSFGTQQQSLREQTRERLQMTLAELGDGGVVRVLVAGKITEGHVLECARLNLARTVDAPCIAVQEQTDHHLRCVGCLPPAILLLIRRVDRVQICLLYTSPSPRDRTR